MHDIKSAMRQTIREKLTMADCHIALGAHKAERRGELQYTLQQRGFSFLRHSPTARRSSETPLWLYTACTAPTGHTSQACGTLSHTEFCQRPGSSSDIRRAEDRRDDGKAIGPSGNHLWGVGQRNAADGKHGDGHALLCLAKDTQ